MKKEKKKHENNVSHINFRTPQLRKGVRVVIEKEDKKASLSLSLSLSGESCVFVINSNGI